MKPFAETFPESGHGLVCAMIPATTEKEARNFSFMHGMLCATAPATTGQRA